MSSDLMPAVVAAGGVGTVMIASILAHEYIRNEAVRKSRVRLGLRFPVALDPVAAKAALGGLSGLSDRMELVFEVAADGDGIRHFLWVPAEVRASAVSVLTGVMPGLRVAEAPVQKGRVTLALRVFIPTPTVLTTENPEAASRTLLSGLSALAPGSEEIIIRWAARPDRPRPLRSNEPMDRAAKETERVWRQKLQVSGGFSASALVLVRAATVPRARELLEHVASTFRSRRGAAGGLRTTSERGGRSLASLPRTTRTSGWVNVAEFLPLLGWPLGDAIPGVEVGASRELLVPRHVPREGRRLFIGRDSVGERPVALSAEAARLHMAVVAPTGGGKSNLLMRCILDDLGQGYGGILLDPKNDLVSDLLDRIPPEHADRIVVLDPSAPGPVPGLDLLGSGDPDVRTEVVLSALKGIYKDAWGVRIDSYLRLGLRTLAELPNPVLSDWMRLYTDSGLRRTAVARLHDPILAAQWRTYEESLSAAEQFQHIAPALSRITSLLSRPALRNIINQPEPKLSIPRLLAERKWLLVALSPTLGESANDLLSAIVGYLVWTAIEQRVSLPAQQRRPVFFYCDELQSLKLPVGLEVFLERSRGLGCGVVAATQGLARLSDSVRNSLLVNVGSLIAMKATGHDEAARLARELPGLQVSDLMGLSSSRFECAARINTGGLGSGSAVVTGRTEGPLPLTGQAATIRALTAERYGTDPRELEAKLRRRVEGQPRTDEGQLGQARRAT